MASRTRLVVISGTRPSYVPDLSAPKTTLDRVTEHVAAAPPRTSAEEPWPVRVVSQKISGWIARLGWIWVDGQLAQVSRRPGSNLVFLTLRDPSAEMSLAVTCYRDTFDACDPPLREGSRVVLHAKPEF